MNKTYPDSVIVDENDTPIGQMQLPEALRQGKKLRVARVMIAHSNGEILLQQRGRNVLSPLLWNDAVSGHVDAGDDYIDTAVREMQEEVGLDVQPQDLEQIDYFYLEEGPLGHQTGRFHTVYRYIYDGDVSVQDEEVESFRWVSVETLEKEITTKPEIFTEGFKYLAHNYIEKFGKH